jgi:hypothetical protein
MKHKLTVVFNNSDFPALILTVEDVSVQQLDGAFIVKSVEGRTYIFRESGILYTSSVECKENE